MNNQPKKSLHEHSTTDASPQPPDSSEYIPPTGPMFLPREDDFEKDSTPTEGWMNHLLPEHRTAAHQLHQEHGTGFLVYLEHFYYQHGAADIDEDFYSTYIGSYDSLYDWVMESYQELGWAEAVEHMMQEHGIPEGALEWSVDYFIHWAKKYQRFQIHPYGGQFHVFQP